MRRVRLETVFPFVADVPFPCGACRGNGRVSVQFSHICGVWFHRRCTSLSISQLRRLKGGEWTSGCSQTTPHSNKIEPPSESANIFARYVDDIIRSVIHYEIDKVFRTANLLHPSFEFTFEHKVNSELAFLDLLITSSQNKLSTSWYTKPSDTGV